LAAIEGGVDEPKVHRFQDFDVRPRVIVVVEEIDNVRAMERTERRDSDGGRRCCVAAIEAAQDCDSPP
jgi:hypothetical protein